MPKTILITGSSTGIGKETAKLFQAKGWNVIATMRTPEKEEELTKFDNVLVNRLDVLDLESIEKAIQEGIAKFGTIDVVVNNAGYGLLGTFESMSRESLQRQFDVNVFGLFDVTRAMLPHFRANKNGLFINISSIGGRMTFPLTSPYNSTKFAIEGFSESLQFELAAIGVGIKVIEPGAIKTDFGGRSLDYQDNEDLVEYVALRKKLKENAEKRAKSGKRKISTPDEVAAVIYQAATDGTTQFRYSAGLGAEKLLTDRKEMTDADFFAMIKKRAGIV